MCGPLLNFRFLLEFHKGQSWVHTVSTLFNDLPDNMQSNVHLFADATAVYLTAQGQEDTDIIQNELNVYYKSGKSMGYGV